MAKMQDGSHCKHDIWQQRVRRQLLPPTLCSHPHSPRTSAVQSGTVAFPLFAGYNASKFGLEAISDCLRYELYEQGIKVRGCSN